TSTKDFAAAVLDRRFRVTKTQGNFNDHVGLPRTMLEATSQDEVAVWEIGMNHPGEVAMLAKLAAPDTAIITNIGVAHIEFMASREAIAVEKGALAQAIGVEGTVILNADDLFSEGIAARTSAKIIFAGITQGTVRASEITQSATGTHFTILEGAHRCRAQLPVPGVHMVQNALLAVAAGRVFGLSLEDCAAGLAAAAADAPATTARPNTTSGSSAENAPPVRDETPTPGGLVAVKGRRRAHPRDEINTTEMRPPSSPPTPRFKHAPPPIPPRPTI